ncbi:MAG: YceI family protein [Saprospiraceae bacterium]|nr:MAG: ycei family protein [Bacteroidetes bacterium OLB9]MCO6462867.1 YceI family protein [Saprospiraceae bacterium]MCZ2337978.1 YceI family protein [Chitinophagales bacterium]
MRSTLFISMIAAFAMFFTSCKEKAVSAPDAIEEAAAAKGHNYIVDTEASVINWEGKKPTDSHKGIIKLSNGNVSVENGTIAAGNFEIDMNSIKVLGMDEEWGGKLESHLKGINGAEADDFFNVSKFPLGKFEIVSITPTSENGATHLVKGNLELKGIAKEVTIPANINVTDGEVVVNSTPFTINRTDWGIVYKSKNVFKNIGDAFVDDNIYMELKVVAKAATSLVQ